MSILSFNYPVTLKKSEGGYLVKFSDFPEAITQGETIEDSLQEAADCLEEAVANRIIMKLNIPNPSPPKKNQFLVSLSTIISAKSALYMTMKINKTSNIDLSKTLNCDEKEVRRLLDPRYPSKLPRIEEALKFFGKKLELLIISDESQPLKNRAVAPTATHHKLIPASKKLDKNRRKAA
jgi:antitoxin HicB